MNRTFQFYKNDATQPQPLGYLTLRKFLEKIKQPSDKTIDILNRIRQSEGEQKAELKKHLYAFTPCVHVNNRRAYSDIIKFTGLLVLDFDKIDNCHDFKSFLFNEYRSIIAAWISPGGQGVKALVNIPICTSVDEFKSYFFGIASEMEMYNGFDGTAQNSVLLLFQSHDSDILIREDFETWNQKGVKRSEFKSTVLPERFATSKITDSHTRWVVRWFSDKINSIVDNGHPQVRDNSVTLGGYVGSGYISHIEAESLSEQLISCNSYLSKGTSGYIKTSKESIRLGISKPLTFN